MTEEIAQTAEAAVLDLHGVGRARLAADGVVLSRLGAASEWLPAPGQNAFDAPVLMGLESQFALARRGALPKILLPGVSLGLRGAFSLSIVWHAADRCFDVLTLMENPSASLDAMLARERRARQLAEEQASAVRVEAERQARFALVMRERLKIAHDLHDTIVHALVGVVAQLGLVRKIARRAPEQAADEIERAYEAARDGLDQARAALGQVRFERAGVDGLGAALTRAAERFSARAGVAVAAQIAPDVAQLSGETAEILYRIVEEALRNVEAHAGATKVRLEARGAEDSLEIEIADDGAGFDPAKDNPGHYGLVGMIEQARMIGGDLIVEAAPGDGATLRVRAPLAPLQKKIAGGFPPSETFA